MRIAIVSDIHGNLPALEAVAKDINRHSVDAVVNLGDSLSGPLMPLETAQFLMSGNWMHLSGNHERQLLTQGPGQWGASDEFTHSQLTSKELEWIASLSAITQFTPEIVFCHGTPTSDSEYFLETVEPSHIRAATLLEVDKRLGEVGSIMVACGHTHVPRSVRASKGTLIVNPGSVGLQAYDDIHPYSHVIETGSPDARYAIVDQLANRLIATLISVPYSFQPMVQLALARKRPDWAYALSSGYIS
jgi:putative phosphoesterase